jgi:hypothetical protein
MGYDIFHSPRKGKKGGSVGFLYKAQLTVKQPQQGTIYKTFEHIEVTFSGINEVFLFSTIYRTGVLTSREQDEFLNELQTHVEELITKNSSIVLWGDFNIHVENKNELFNKEFQELLEILGFVQLVNQPTHSAGGILDLIFVKESHRHCKVVVYDEDSGEQLSDHYAMGKVMSHKVSF